jgi:hypothetical protein
MKPWERTELEQVEGAILRDLLGGWGAKHPGEGWSYALELPPEPTRWTPAAFWDLPDPDGDLMDGAPSAAPLELLPSELEESAPEGEKQEALRYPVPGRPRYCGRYTVAGELKGPDGAPDGRMGAARVYCRRYLCPVCGPARARLTRKAIRGAVEKHGLCRMLTLTLDPKRLEVGEDAHARIKTAFNRLRYRWQKAYRKGVEYVAVIEHHKSGMPHLHVAVSRFLPRKLIQRWWQKAGGGAQVWISYRQPGRAGSYIGKYIGKQLRAELAGELMPLRSRRVQTSRGIRLFPPRERAGWLFIRENIDRIARAAGVLREVLDVLTVEVDYSRRLRFLICPKEKWWQVGFLVGFGTPA